MSRRVQVIRWEEKSRIESSSKGENRPSQKTRRKMVPLSKKEITCLKAVNDLSQRGFGKISKRDIMRAATRVYPEFDRMALNEYEILECLEKLKRIGYVKGYGHLRLDHQSFVMTNVGRDVIRNLEQMPIMEQPSPERRASRSMERIIRRLDTARVGVGNRQRRVQIKNDLNDLTQADSAILQVIDKLKNARSMSKVLHNDVWRMGQREFPSFIMEHTLLEKLGSLIDRGYIKWVGHYTLTEKGQNAANMISRAREISYRNRG